MRLQKTRKLNMLDCLAYADLQRSVLLSIQLLLQMAIEELYLYAFEIKVDILYPSYGGEYIESADFFAGFLESLIHEIESRLQSANSPAIRRLLHRAHKDMAYVSPTERKDEPILEYERNGHGCFAYILHLYQVRKGMRLNKEQTEALCRTRKTFMGAWKNALRTSGIHDTDAYHELLSFGMDLLESQVFTPREALKIPSIMQDVRKDGRMDVLMRTIAFMEHDAGIRRPWPEDTLKEKDLLDRTSIDLACLRKDSNLLEQIVTKEPSILKWCPEPFSIAIAASLGYLAPIEALRKYNEVEFRARILDASTMHVAAATGQVNIAKYLLEHLPTEDLIYAKEFFTGLVPCQYAAKAGQVQMLDLLCDKDANCRQIVDDEGRPLSWYAREEDHIELAQQLAALENARPPPASNSTSRTSPPAGTPPAARSVSWEGPSQAAIPHLEQVPQPQTESLATSLAAKTPHICDDCSTLLFGSRDELLYVFI